jgi:hypothetical protein
MLGAGLFGGRDRASLRLFPSADRIDGITVERVRADPRQRPTARVPTRASRSGRLRFALALAAAGAVAFVGGGAARMLLQGAPEAEETPAATVAEPPPLGAPVVEHEARCSPRHDAVLAAVAAAQRSDKAAARSGGRAEAAAPVATAGHAASAPDGDELAAAAAVLAQARGERSIH